MKQPKEQTLFDWDEETGIATCILIDKNNRSFYGKAACHPEDKDMKSEKTGGEIALRRAYISALKFYRDNDVKNTLKEFKRFYYSVINNQQYDPDSFLAKRLFNHIRKLEKELENIKILIKEQQQDLNDYIENKDIFYKQVRNHREKRFKQAMQAKYGK